MAGGLGKGILTFNHLGDIWELSPLSLISTWRPLWAFLTLSVIVQKGKMRCKGQRQFMPLLRAEVSQGRVLDPPGREERTERRESQVRKNLVCHEAFRTEEVHL